MAETASMLEMPSSSSSFHHLHSFIFCLHGHAHDPGANPSTVSQIPAPSRHIAWNALRPLVHKTATVTSFASASPAHRCDCYHFDTCLVQEEQLSRAKPPHLVTDTCHEDSAPSAFSSMRPPAMVCRLVESESTLTCC